MTVGEQTSRPADRLARIIAALLHSAALGAPLAIATVGAAPAQSLESARLSADVPAQSLALALAAVSDQTGVQIVYVSQLVRGMNSLPVQAGASVDEALSRMLTGSGLLFEYLTPHSIRIFGAALEPTRFSNETAEERPDTIIVTANRRDEVLQTVPMTIQVLTGVTLSNLNVTTFDDFVKYLPGVSAHGLGPAQNTIYMRGLGTSEAGNQAAGTNGIFPNVAVYLDEQSAQLPSRNLDVYAADMERIEVLEGPQGTLFGAGAEAGAIRYITNKPKLGLTEGSVDARYTLTAHGDPGAAVVGVINIPILQDRLAVRGVIYNDRRGGYIDNLPATFTRLPSDASIRYANYPAGCGGSVACQVPPNNIAINNAAAVGGNVNPLTYQGLRIQALYQVDDSWSVLLAQSYQSMVADGVFAETVADNFGTPLPPLSTQLFNPSYNKDRFENTALTVNGRLGALQVVYAEMCIRDRSKGPA